MGVLARRIANARAQGVARTQGLARTQAQARKALGVDPIVAVRNFSGANYLQTPNAGGGEVGVATGFGNVLMFRLNRLPSALGVLRSSLGSSGWQQIINSNNTLSANYHNGSSFVASSTYQLNASDVGRIHILITRISPTPGLQKLYVDKYSAADITQSGYLNTATAPETLGAYSGGGTPSTSALEVIAELDFRGDPTNAQLDALLDTARTNGDLPLTFTGATVTHHRSAKLDLAKLIDQSMPSNGLTDNITGLSADGLKQPAGGNGLQIVKIDPSLDGRRSLGAQGFSDASHYKSAVGAGLQGSATGFTHAFRVRWDASPAGFQILACAANAAATATWFVRTNGTALTASVNATSTSAYTIAASDLGQWITVHIQYTGSVLRLFVRGAQIGADVAVAWPSVASTQMWVGDLPTAPFSSGSITAIAGGNYIASSAEIQQQVTDTDSTGRLVPVPNKDAHSWDWTADILASGVDAVPATVTDRVGTDNLTRIGPDITVGGKQGLKLLGVGSALTNGLQTVQGGGIQGSASALTVSMLYVPTAVCAGTVEVPAGKFIAAPAAGWNFLRQGTIGANGTLSIAVVSSGSGTTSNTPYAIQTADLGTLMHLALTYDGNNMRFYVNGALIDTKALVGTFAPASTPMVIGTRSDGNPCVNDQAFFAIGGGSYVATTAELLAQSTASRAAGQLVAIPGRTDERRYNYDQDATDQATSLPAKCIDRMGNADPLVRQGSGLTLAQRTERIYSWEGSPIEYGADAFTDTDYFGSAAGTFPGAAAGWWWCQPIVIESQSVTSKTRSIVGENGGPGWEIRTSGTNSLLLAVASDGGGVFRNSPSITISASDLGKLLLFFVVWDGAKLHTYAKRVENSTGTAMTGYTPANGSISTFFRMGRHTSSATLNADGIRALGGMGGNSIPSLAEIQAAHDAYLAFDDIVEIPGKTDYFQSMKLDVIANGGTLPATLTDRKGGKNLAKTGAPATVPMYARAASW